MGVTLDCVEKAWFDRRDGILFDVVMIESIRSDDDFGVSKYVGRNGPPAGQGALNEYYKYLKY